MTLRQRVGLPCWYTPKEASMSDATMIDLGPAARAVADLLPGVADEQLSAPTPCAQTSVAELLDHFLGLTLAFRWAATKEVPGAEDGSGGGPGPTGGADLDPDWRRRLPGQLDELVEAWREPAAWTGTTQAGGVSLPGDVAGLVALNELVIHGWDLARATGQDLDCDPTTAEAAFAHVAQFASPEGTEGLFGPAIEVPADRPLLDRAVGLSGRDPDWTP
jgi:uncharacterized protein (TIGR03086 family)